jgi:hypothetical protein
MIDDIAVRSAGQKDSNLERADRRTSTNTRSCNDHRKLITRFD